VKETRFLVLIIDDTLSWKQHIEQIKKKLHGFSPLANYTNRAITAGQRVNKIAIACYAVRNIKHIVSIEH
jgi:hypothetical protein